MSASTTSAPICIVDDDASLGRALGRLLRSAGLCSHAFVDPCEFLQYAEANPVPFVILDVMMPGLSGLEVQQRLREVAPGAVVIVVTSRTDVATYEAAMAAG
jgi:FixJ family two-component response regulator